jgi:hypothetical protein
LYRRPFQYNVPFSNILFNHDFLHRYNKFLKTHPNLDYFAIREFVVNYIIIWSSIRGAGHLAEINKIMQKLTIKELPVIKDTRIKDAFIEYSFTYYYIIF